MATDNVLHEIPMLCKHSILSMTQRDNCYNTHFTNEETGKFSDLPKVTQPVDMGTGI